MSHETDERWKGESGAIPPPKKFWKANHHEASSPRDNENAGVVYFMKLSPWQKAGVRLVLHSPRLTLNLSLLLYDGYFLGKSSDIASPIPKNLFHNRNGSAVKNVR